MIIKQYPAALAYTLAALIDALIATGLPWSDDQKAAAITIVTGALTIVSAFAVRPIPVGLIGATLTTMVTAVSAFNLDLNLGAAQAWVVAFVALAAFLTHQVVSPPGGTLDTDPQNPKVLR